MQKVTTFLTFNDQAEEAVKLYISVIPNSRIVSTTRYGAAGPGAKGGVMTLNFQLAGQDFIALNGGPSFQFAQGISLFVSCENQREIDEYWEKLSAGGSEGPCGWLTDRFGVSWQIVPRVLGEMIASKDAAKADRAMKAMLQMKKLDIAKLEQAYAEESSEVEARS